MKFLAPLFPILISISLIGALAIFIAGTFIFLAVQAFYDIYFNNGVIVAYLGTIAGVMLFSCISYQMIKGAFRRSANKKKNLVESGISLFEPVATIIISVIVYEGLKFYLNRKSKNNSTNLDSNH